MAANSIQNYICIDLSCLKQYIVLLREKKKASKLKKVKQLFQQNLLLFMNFRCKTLMY